MLWMTAALVGLTVTLWATRWLPEHLAGLLFFTIAMVLGLGGAATVFSGFASSAFWLVFGGFVLGAAIRKTGLAERVARLLAARLGSSSLGLVSGVVGLSYALAFVMPSNMGRIALLMPIVMALADQLGLAPGTRGRIGMALAVGFGTYMLSVSILPANVPNQVMAGAIETSYHQTLTYLAYLVLHAPVLGVLKGLVLIGSLRLMFAARPRAVAALPPLPPLSADERRLGAILLVTLALWFTDAWHGIAPAWIGLAAAVVCLLPRVGFLDSEAFAGSVNVRTLIHIAAILGLAALVTHSGLGDVVGRALVAAAPLDPASPFESFAAMTGLSIALNFLVTANGIPALYTPLAAPLSAASGMPLLTVLMIQVVGFSTVVLPYQAAPIVLAIELGGVPARDAVRLCLVLTAITLLVLVPLDYLWFAALGML